VGTDAAGRRQYIYHERWHDCRDREKYGRIMEFARALPALRARVGEDLRRDDLSREHVLAAAVRILDLGLFRIGGESYAVQNATFGLATVLLDHVTVSRSGEVWFHYDAKGGIERRVSLTDPDVRRVVSRLKRRRGGGRELLAFRNGGRAWRDVRSSDINDYIKEAGGAAYTAKDFRTWHATVIAALGLARVARRPLPRRNPVPSVVRDVAAQLGNTPVVARASYIHPYVIEAFERGDVIDLPGDLPEQGSYPLADHDQHRLERAVAALLERFDERLDAGFAPPFSLSG
jgi:DNA topoisomerase IB